ncbi:MAG: GSCFA domain-containing protein [Bacteroidales bacterium]|nr:GSCFA domain-containing protein [Bacteroidales bacterium]
MELLTTVEIPKSNISIDYNSKLVFVGSCFAENVSRFFMDAKFNCLVNPTGIMYNPLSIRQMVANVVKHKTYDYHDFFFDGNNYSSYDFHSAYSRSTLQEAVSLANERIEAARSYCYNADIVFVTLGTAFVYFLADSSGSPVNNCHKQKSETFVRRLISVEEVADALSDVVAKLLAINSKLQFVFTVSPIRHWKDGAHANRLSKSTLHLGIEQVLRQFDCCEYFPSCEILEDELRDYRFYAEDMIHPSPLAEKIIWRRLRDTYINKVCDAQISRVEKFMQAANHRFFDDKAPSTISFCQKNILLAESLESEIQGLDLSSEKKHFKKYV